MLKKWQSKREGEKNQVKAIQSIDPTMPDQTRPDHNNKMK